MKSTNWKNIAEIVGIAAIVSSLIFVGLQMRQDRQLARAAAFVDLATTHIELSQLITDNQSIWVMGLDGEELSNEDQAAFDQIARSWFIRFRSDYYLRVPKAARQISSSSFSGLVEKRLAELDKESPPIPDDKTYMIP